MFSSILAIIGKFLGRAIYTICNILIARFVSPALFGQYSIIWVTNRIGYSFTSLGFENLVILKLKNKNHDERWGALKTYSLVLFLISGIISLLLILVLMESSSIGMLITIGFLPVLAFIKVRNAITRLESQRNTFFFEDFLQPIVYILLIAFALHIDNENLLLLVFALNFSYVFIFIHLFFVDPKFRKAKFDFSILNTFFSDFKYAISTSLTGFILVFYTMYDKYLIQYQHSEVEVGYYQSMVQIAFIIPTFISGLNQSLFPSLVKCDKKEYSKKFYEINSLVYLFSPPLIVFVIVFSEDILSMLYKDVYAENHLVLSIYGFGYLLLLYVLNLNILFNVIKKSYLNFFFLVLGLIISVCVNLIFGSKGLLIYAFSFVGSFLMSYLLQYLYLKREIGFDLNKSTLKNFLISLLSLALVWLVSRFVNFNNQILQLGFGLFSSSLIFFGLKYVLKLDNQEKKILNTLIEFIR